MVPSTANLTVQHGTVQHGKHTAQHSHLAKLALFIQLHTAQLRHLAAVEGDPLLHIHLGFIPLSPVCQAATMGGRQPACVGSSRRSAVQRSASQRSAVQCSASAIMQLRP